MHICPSPGQSAVARFDQYGFEAAALTSVTMGSRRPSEPILVRDIRASFDRPFAVHAVSEGGGWWYGLPLFDAWITEISEASPARTHPDQDDF